MKGLLLNTRDQRLHNEIFKLLDNHSDIGVNEIARKLDTPVATIQRFLVRQNYFIRNDRRKWQLPAASKNWPKETLDEKVPDKIREFIEDPVANLGDILKTVNIWKSQIELTQQRMQFLKLLAEKAVKDI